MRVVAGELGGRRLVAPRGDGVRPTSDRAREAVFSILGDVGGAAVLDLYCGTGALGIEALSRGASPVVMVDTDTAPAGANVKALGVGDRVELVRSDALAYLRSATREFHLILCDPPYRLADRLGHELRECIASCLRPGGTIVVESPARAPIDLGDGFALDADRTYGDASMRVWTVS